jgi:hypothetical protein
LHHQAQVSRRVLGGATARRGGCARGLRHDSSSLPGTRAHLRDRLALLTQPPAMGSSLSTAQQPTAAYAVYASHTWVGVRRLCVAVALMALEPSARWHEAPPATMMCIRSAVHSVLQYHTAYGAAWRMAEAVLAAIRAVTGPAGALLVVKNYTGAWTCVRRWHRTWQNSLAGPRLVRGVAWVQQRRRLRACGSTVSVSAAAYVDWASGLPTVRCICSRAARFASRSEHAHWLNLLCRSLFALPRP